jgi:hypothetical protein
MKKVIIIIFFVLIPNLVFSGEYSSLLKKSKTKNSDKLVKVMDETILGLKFEKKIVQICYDEMKIINKEQKHKTVNEIKKCDPLVNRYMDYIDLTKIYESKSFAKKIDKIYYKIKDGKITSLTLSDFENKINELSNAATEIDNLYTEIRLLDPRN